MTTTSVMRKQLFINGEWRDASGGKTIEVVNPATEEVIAAVASAEQRDVDAAVAAARAALDGPWGKLSARDRGRLVQPLMDLGSDPWPHVRKLGERPVHVGQIGGFLAPEPGRPRGALQRLSAMTGLLLPGAPEQLRQTGVRDRHHSRCGSQARVFSKRPTSLPAGSAIIAQ